MRIFLLVALLLPEAVFAQWSSTFNVVKMHIDPGYPLPNAISRSVDYEISGIAELNGQNYFGRVRRLLREGNVPHKWGSVVIDSSWIKIEIQLGDEKFEIANTYGSDGLLRYVGDSSTDKDVGAAVQKIIDLTSLEATSKPKRP
jgi:hypothetical protein